MNLIGILHNNLDMIFHKLVKIVKGMDQLLIIPQESTIYLTKIILDMIHLDI